ncbi:unnamed protein product, partial [Brassicogethes aeneus]
RADYWKSNDRKYCDYCKCWITDNKPSVEFHEKGRKHQENVKRRLNQITRNSAKAQRESEKVDSQMRQMEALALAAYRKDVANNADMTSVAINNKLKEDNLAISSGSKKVWKEAKSKDGNFYYWNVLTNETKWEKPEEGYCSIEEQDKEKYDEGSKQLRALEKQRQREGLMRLQQQKRADDEERAKKAREKLKERAVKNDEPEPVYGPIIEPGKNDPYGKWHTVKESAPLELDLPPQNDYYVPVIEVEPEPVVKEFKEKTVSSLEGGETSFKKRKIPGGAKRNTRQRVDDD